MPQLPDPRHEAFCRFIAQGMSQKDAYVAAGYTLTTGGPSRLAGRKKIKARLAELGGALQTVVAKRIAKLAPGVSTDKQIPREMTFARDAIARELASMAFANVADYLEINGEDVHVDLSKATRDQLAAVKEVTVETYVERGDKAWAVKRVRLKLHEKGANLLNLTRLMGWIDEPDETGGLAERLRKMTPEERAEDARQLAERIKQRLIEAGRLPPDDGVDNVTDDRDRRNRRS